MKYLGLTLTKYVQDMHAKNNKIMTKEMKKIPNKWKEILCWLTEKLTIVKMSSLPKFIYIFKAIQSKSQQDLL